MRRNANTKRFVYQQAGASHAVETQHVQNVHLTQFDRAWTTVSKLLKLCSIVTRRSCQGLSTELPNTPGRFLGGQLWHFEVSQKQVTGPFPPLALFADQTAFWRHNAMNVSLGDCL